MKDRPDESRLTPFEIAVEALEKMDERYVAGVDGLEYAVMCNELACQALAAIRGQSPAVSCHEQAVSVRGPLSALDRLALQTFRDDPTQRSVSAPGIALELDAALVAALEREKAYQILLRDCGDWIEKHHEMPGYSELLLRVREAAK